MGQLRKYGTLLGNMGFMEQPVCNPGSDGVKDSNAKTKANHDQGHKKPIVST